jgi:hypothetical protein
MNAIGDKACQEIHDGSTTDELVKILLNLLRLFGEVYEVDKSLFIDGHRSWQKFIHNSLQNLNLTSLDFDINKINQLLTDQQKLPVNITRELTKLRLSSHSLLNRPLQATYQREVVLAY